MNEPVPEALGSLIDAERSAPTPDDAAKRAIRARVVATLGVLPPGAGGAAGSAPSGAAGAGGAVAGSGVAAKTVAIAVTAAIAGGTTIGVVVHRNADSSATKPPAAVAAPAVAPKAETQPSTPPPPASTPAAAPVVQAPEPAVRPRAAAPVVKPDPTPAEATLLADASRALSTGDAAAALRSLETDTRLYPDGSLAEEREALHVQALVALGRSDDARSEAVQFIAEHPQSIYRGLVERALSTEETEP